MGSSRRRRKKTNFLPIFVIILIISITGGYFFVNGLKNPVDPKATADIEFTVPQGSGANQIGQALKAQGLIKNARYFSYFAKKNNLTDFKYGVYDLKKSDDLLTIIKRLNEGGRPEGEKVTIIEGSTIKDIAKLMDQKGIMSAQQFLDAISDKSKFETEFDFLKQIPNGNLEGYLYPATYFFTKNEAPEEVVKKLLQQTQKVFTDNNVLNSYSKVSPKIKDLNDFITLCSIVQGESGKVDDMRKIAGVFLKRLSIDMKLQSDATMQYITGENKPRLSYDDISSSNPYNTYKHAGLTPGPICTPSIAAINAVLNPDDTDYLYFVADMQGNTYFSKTYEEHLAKTKEIYGEY